MQAHKGTGTRELKKETSRNCTYIYNTQQRYISLLRSIFPGVSVVAHHTSAAAAAAAAAAASAISAPLAR